MRLQTLQTWNRQSVAQMKAPFRSGTEVMLALTEELGEIAKEVAQLEQIGSKVEWERAPSVERLGEEITHLLNLTCTLANLYTIDLAALYAAKLTESSEEPKELVS